MFCIDYTPIEEIIKVKLCHSCDNDSQICISFLIFPTVYSKLPAGHFHMEFMPASQIQHTQIQLSPPSASFPHL